MKKKIAIYGAGGLGKEVLSLLNALPEWEVIGFYDDGKAKGSAVKQLFILGGMKELLEINESLNLVFAIGDPKIKAGLAEKLRENNLINYPALMHPSAIIYDIDSVKMGQGVILTAGVIVTCDVELGDHVLLNLNTTVGHDTKIGSCCSLMPGVNIAGEVIVGEKVFIGSGANVLNGLYIGAGSRIGSGAVVTKNIDEGETVVGVPAGPINRNA